MSDNSSESSSSQAQKIVVEPDATELLQTTFARKDPLEGKTIGDNNRYLLQTLLGQEGISKVYKALDTHFENRVVAIKLMTIDSSANAKHLVEKFMEEIKAISNLQHPNIVHIFDYGITPDGIPFYSSPFYVMDYLTGQTLKDRLAKHKTLPLDSLLNIFRQVCAGLKEAHQKGIVHQNLTSNNIFLVDNDAGDEVVKIIDFGIAKNVSYDEQKYGTKPQAGYFCKTYRYASPEQCLGLPNIDQRTDIYSLGLILYEAICGTNPYDVNFNSTEIDWSNYHIKIPPKPLKKQAGMEYIDSKLENIVMKCLAKSPQYRFINIEELQYALIRELQDALIEELQGALVNSSSPQNYGDQQDTKTSINLKKNSLHDKINEEVKRPSIRSVAKPNQNSTPPPISSILVKNYDSEKNAKASTDLDKNILDHKIDEKVEQAFVKTKVTNQQHPDTPPQLSTVVVQPSKRWRLLAGFIAILTVMIVIWLFRPREPYEPYLGEVEPIPRLVWLPSCGDPGPPATGSTWWPVRGNPEALTLIKSNYCGDAYITGNETQVASFSSYYSAEQFAEVLSRETGKSFWVGRPSQY